MNDAPIVAVILAGGSGKRFWPLSSPEEPKQFLRVADDRSMIQATWQRLDGLVPPERRLIVTSRDHAATVREHLPDLPPENLVGEPEQRDTAAAAILGAALAEKRWPGAVAVTLPADHLIEPGDAFRHLVERTARLAARERRLVTIGIAPTYAADCYGYIERGRPLEIGGGLKAFHVARFAEKPDAATAADYIARGSFYWNAGIFIWPAAELLEEARRHMAGHHRELCGAAEAWGDARWAEAFAEAYARVEKISIDYGIMERTDRAAVVEATFRWSDLGGWIAVGDLLAEDGSANRRRGRTIVHDACGNVIYNADGRTPVLCIGLSDMIVARTEHGVLVCPKDRLEEIKKAVEGLYEA